MLSHKIWQLVCTLSLLGGCESPHESAAESDASSDGRTPEVELVNCPRSPIRANPDAGTRCDGVVDCFTGDDERDCPGQILVSLR